MPGRKLCCLFMDAPIWAHAFYFNSFLSFFFPPQLTSLAAWHVLPPLFDTAHTWSLENRLESAVNSKFWRRSSGLRVSPSQQQQQQCNPWGLRWGRCNSNSSHTSNKSQADNPSNHTVPLNKTASHGSMRRFPLGSPELPVVSSKQLTRRKTGNLNHGNKTITS